MGVAHKLEKQEGPTPFEICYTPYDDDMIEVPFAIVMIDCQSILDSNAS